MHKFLFVFLLGVGCSDGGDDSNPPADDSSTDDSAADDTGKPVCDDAITWTTWAEKFFATYCTSCHSSELTGPDRHNAPAGANFDTYAGVEDKWGYILDVATGFNPSMPKSGQEPTDEEREILAAWINCGLAK